MTSHFRCQWMDAIERDDVIPASIAKRVWNTKILFAISNERDDFKRISKSECKWCGVRIVYIFTFFGQFFSFLSFVCFGWLFAMATREKKILFERNYDDFTIECFTQSNLLDRFALCCVYYPDLYPLHLYSQSVTHE